MYRRLVIPYNDETHPFAGLANWSCLYPFETNGVRYPSVDHYIFCRLTLHKNDARLLSVRANDPVLRSVFNGLANEVYYDLLRESILQGAKMQYLDEDAILRDVINRRPSNYYYYITNDDTLWGINEHGYGFNLLGQSYARLLDPQHSSFYRVTSESIFTIYRASELCQHHLRQGYSIDAFIGRPVDEIVASLEATYPSFRTPTVSPAYVFERRQQHPFIQYEIDYPWNLAGFIRQKYAENINYYLRQRFHRTMILHYFKYVLRQKFKDVVVDVERVAEQQFARLSEKEYEDIADRLYRVYNDPDTTSKTRAFLTPEARQELLEIEMQFLNAEEQAKVANYVPFLYHIKTGHTTYIYDDNHEFTDELEPFTKILSPFQYNPLKMDGVTYDNLGQFVFTKMIHEWTAVPIEDAHRSVRMCVDMSDYQDAVHHAIRTFKRLLLRKAMLLKFRSSVFARYALYNTQSYGYDMHVLDPDPTLEVQGSKELLAIRTKLEADSMYAITYALSTSHDPYLQDRIRFRMEDFVRVFDAYRRFLNQDRLTVADYQRLETTLYRDPPATSSAGVTKMPPSFSQFFEGTCDETTIRRLWQFFVAYNTILESYLTRVPSKEPCTPPKIHITSMSTNDRTSPPTTVTGIVCYFLNTFYTKGEEMAFYVFTLSVLLGQRVTTFRPSFAYYSVELERELGAYLDMDDYSVEFLVNVMGVIAKLQREMPDTRVRYFGYFVKPPTYTTTTPVASLTRRLQSLGYPAIVGKKKGKRGNRKSKETILKEMSVREQEEQEQQQEQQDSIEDMYQELGLDDDDDEEEEEEFEQEDDES